MTTIGKGGATAPTQNGAATSTAATPPTATTSAATPSAPEAKTADELHPPIDGFDDGPSTSTTSRAADPRASSEAPKQLADEVSGLRNAAHSHSARAFGDSDTAAHHVIEARATGSNIRVSPGSSGGLSVNVDGRIQQLDKKQADRLVIRGGDGDDTITVDESVKRSITIEGGKGADILTGGSGNDMIVGGEGADTIDGRKGRDYIDGGRDGDTISGGAGNDTVIGGRGADTLSGGTGRNTLVGGEGQDTFVAGAGADRAIGERADNKPEGWSKAGGDRVSVVDVSSDTEATQPGHSINIQGDVAFKAKVNRDLDVLRSTQTGRELLSELDTAAAAGKPVSIAFTEGDAGTTGADPRSRAGMIKDDRTANTGIGSDVTYDPSDARYGTRTDGFHRTPPSVKLFHELVHAHHNAQGTGLPINEPTALKKTVKGHDVHPDTEEARTTGVDYWKYNADGEPVTHRGKPVWNSASRERFTENKLRAELGLLNRDAY